MAYLDWKMSQPERLEWYLAQLTMIVASLFAKKGKKFKISDFILKFTSTARKVKKKRRSTLYESKAAWLGWLGIPWSAEEEKKKKQKEKDDGQRVSA